MAFLLYSPSVLLIVATLAVASASSSVGSKPCKGSSAKYEVTFSNFLSPNYFGNLIPEEGLVFSPLAGVSHSNRVSLLTARGFASEPVRLIAEKGDNAPLVKVANSLKGMGTKSVVGAKGPTLPGLNTTLTLMVDCKNPFITVLGMIAPSPDWFVQISNYNLYNSRVGAFTEKTGGYLIAYDAGTDSGGEFTDPMNEKLDMPSNSPHNIAPLFEDKTDPFGRKVVGKFAIHKVKM